MQKINEFKYIKNNLVKYYIKKFKDIDEILTIKNTDNQKIFWHLLVVHLSKKYLHLKKKINDLFEIKKNNYSNSL